MLFSILKEGRGRGNWGHAGIPGHRGGSAPSSSVSGGPLPPVPSSEKASVGTSKKGFLNISKIEESHPNLHENLGSSLKIEVSEISENVKNHLDDLEKVPGHVLKEVSDFGVTTHLGDTAMPDLDTKQDSKGVKVRGWNGETWDNVAGAFDSKKKMVLAGKGLHDCSSLVLHEFGHALDEKRKIAETDKEFDSIHKKLHRDKKLDSYFKQGGPGGLAGKEELFAEGFALYHKDKASLKTQYGDRIVKFFDNEMSPTPQPRTVIVKKPVVKKVDIWGTSGSFRGQGKRTAIDDILDSSGSFGYGGKY